jgi:hypothetical protein
MIQGNEKKKRADGAQVKSGKHFENIVHNT